MEGAGVWERRTRTCISGGVGAGRGRPPGEPIRHTTTKVFNDLWPPQYENQEKRSGNAPYQDASKENAIHEV